MKPVFLLLAAFSIFSLSLHAQLLVEDFDYSVGESLTTHGWVAHSGAGSVPVVVTTPGLTFPSYPGSGVGNATTVAGASGTREDVNRTFAQQASGFLYAAFLVNIASVGTGGDYFLHFLSGTTNIARVFVQRDASNTSLFAFGLSMSSSSPTYAASTFSTTTTYLLVLKYAFISGVDNDEVSLYIFSSAAPTSEPASPTLGPFTGTTDASNIGSIALRQGSNAYNVVVDGLEVGTTWFEVGLPVQLAGFSGYVQDSEVHLDWTTLSEINNYGFVVENTRNMQGSWQEIPGSFLPGYGTTSQPHSYSYVHTQSQPGIMYYRLRQIDLNGANAYSDPILIDIPTSVSLSLPAEFRLEQNVPNPFNPNTEIRFSVESLNQTSLVAFNILGQPVATLFQGYAEPPKIYSVQWNAHGFPSGLYFYKLESGNKTSMKKMTLLK